MALAATADEAAVHQPKAGRVDRGFMAFISLILHPNGKALPGEELGLRFGGSAASSRARPK